MKTKIDKLKEYIEEMKQEKLEAQIILETRQQDIDAAFCELEKLESK